MKSAPLDWTLRGLLVVVATAGAPSPGTAQAVTGGIRADLALASFRNEDFDQSRRVGIRIGVFGDLELSSAVDLRGEIVYANKGSKYEGADGAFALEYVEIPLAAKIALGRSPVYILAGPAVAFLVDSPFEDSDALNKVDVGLLGGIGVDASLGDLPVTFDVRYTTGFGTIFDYGPDDSDTDDRNQVISFGMGVKVF